MKFSVETLSFVYPPPRSRVLAAVVLRDDILSPVGTIVSIRDKIEVGRAAGKHKSADRMDGAVILLYYER